jgi:hypothetical protein
VGVVYFLLFGFFPFACILFPWNDYHDLKTVDVYVLSCSYARFCRSTKWAFLLASSPLLSRATRNPWARGIPSIPNLPFVHQYLICFLYYDLFAEERMSSNEMTNGNDIVDDSILT